LAGSALAVADGVAVADGATGVSDAVVDAAALAPGSARSDDDALPAGLALTDAAGGVAEADEPGRSSVAVPRAGALPDADGAGRTVADRLADAPPRALANARWRRNMAPPANPAATTTTPAISPM
jgi:hypothetical protein